MNNIYEDAFAEMTALLKDTLEDLSKAYGINTTEPLFCISNKKFILMEKIARSCNSQVLSGCIHLCFDLCRQREMNVRKTPELKEVDFICELCGKTTGFHLSLSSKFMLEIEDALKLGVEEIFVVVLQETQDDNPMFYRPNSKKYKEYPYKGMVKNITIKQFFEMIGATGYDDFREYIGRYNYDAEQMLGMTVSLIPTKKAIEEHKTKIKSVLISFFYEEKLRQYFSVKDITCMKEQFCKKYDVLLSDTDFSKSLISSEWYYDLQVKTDGGIEQTAIVAGYLKSLEQLLCSSLLTLSEDCELIFATNKMGREQTGKDKLPLTHENLKLVNTTAGYILSRIEANKKSVLYKTNVTDRVIVYLKDYVKKSRNAYMHKDNIYELSEIEDIRTKTYCAYFLILSTFKIDIEKLSHINDC